MKFIDIKSLQQISTTKTIIDVAIPTPSTTNAATTFDNSRVRAVVIVCVEHASTFLYFLCKPRRIPLSVILLILQGAQKQLNFSSKRVIVSHKAVYRAPHSLKNRSTFRNFENKGARFRLL